MDWVAIIKALVALGAIGLVFGIVLSIADKKLKVEVDPRISAVKDALGGANCGACGFAGCDAFAEAVVLGTAKPNACPSSDVVAVGSALGITIETSAKLVARVICQGHHGVAVERYEYDGYKSCATAAGIAGGPKVCHFSCIGLGDCTLECAYDAIKIKDGLAVVDENNCVGCGMCALVCPRNSIKIIPAQDKVLVLCQNSDTGRAARKACMKACIACNRCVKECKYDAIKVENGCAVIDHEKCTRCGECARVCPSGCIENYSLA